MVTDVKGVREGYKMTELGEIPEEWGVLTTGSLFENQSIKGNPNLPVLSVTQESGVVYRDAVGINIKYDKKSLKTYKLVDEGQFVISLRSFQGGIEYSSLKGIVSPAYTVLSEKEKVDRDYFRHFFKSFWFIERLKKSIIGIRDGKQINYADFKIIKIPFPPLTQQNKIANILTSIDETIEKTNQLLEKTKELKKGLMQQLLTKGIGHTRFKKTELGEIPEGWSVAKINEVATTASGGTPNRKNKSYYEDASIPWIKTGELKSKYIFSSSEHITDGAIKKSSAKWVSANSVVMAMYGATIGQCSILKVPATTNQACCVITPKYEHLSEEFLYYYLKFVVTDIISLSAGGAQPNISQQIIKNFKIKIPSLSEQRKIALILSTNDEQIDTYTKEKERLQELKKGLMRQLLTGQVKVTV